MFVDKAGAYLSGAAEINLGKLLALSANIRLGCKCLPVTNTQTFYENSQITDAKSFITLVPGALSSARELKET